MLYGFEEWGQVLKIDILGLGEMVGWVAFGDVVYYFTEKKEDQSLTEPAEIAGKGRVGLSNRERADWIKGAPL